MTVLGILDDVRDRGVEAALEYTRIYDGVNLDQDMVTWNPLTDSALPIESRVQEAIEFAIERIESFHRATRPQDIPTEPESGLSLVERWMPIPRVGVYIPNGAFPLISSALMTIIPARVAGVTEIVAAVSPRRDIRLDPLWRYVFQRLQISEVLLLGGAQAIAVLGYGVERLQPVHLIAGPGNRYVAEAKQEMARRGIVGIDLSAGPSEVMVIANQLALEDYVVADLLAQAEHDVDARAELVSMNAELAARVGSRVAELPKGFGKIVITHVESMEDAVQRANQQAPEHLGLMGADAEVWADRIWAAGALFVGPLSGQAFGDYVAGPSHVLPTGGTGRFQSGLSTRTFMKRVSVIEAHRQISSASYRHAEVLAEIEGLEYHKRSMTLRQKRREEESRDASSFH